MLTGADNEAQLIAPTEFVPPPAAVNPAEAGEKVRGFRVGKYRVRHLKSTHPEGWGHDEGDSVSRTLFSMDFIYEGTRRCAFRIIAGRHSLWFFN
jgi:hypothetical protein